MGIGSHNLKFYLPGKVILIFATKFPILHNFSSHKMSVPRSMKISSTDGCLFIKIHFDPRPPSFEKINLDLGNSCLTRDHISQSPQNSQCLWQACSSERKWHCHLHTLAPSSSCMQGITWPPGMADGRNLGPRLSAGRKATTDPETYSLHCHMNKVVLCLRHYTSLGLFFFLLIAVQLLLTKTDSTEESYMKNISQ